MGFWARMFGTEGITANANGPIAYEPGDPDGIEYNGELVEPRGLPGPPSVMPWSGWPEQWQTPAWNEINGGLNRLVDIAWACLDLNANVISSMPVYRLANGVIVGPETWMTNPDPLIYSCWQEFARQLFWDYMLGEAFVLPMAMGSDNYPLTFRVVPPWLINVEMDEGFRRYWLGGREVTDEILHIRYHATTWDPRGHGPLEVAGARMTTVTLLQRYTSTLAENGGVPLYWMELARSITESEGKDLMERWIESRARNAGQPALVAGGAKLNQAHIMNAKDMALMELSQFNESRICNLLGVPPAVMSLAGASGSLTYANTESIYDFHDRSSLRPKSRFVMQSLSNWALPRGQSVELNRDDYTRLPMDKRALIYKTLHDIVDPATGQRALSIEQIQSMERFVGEQTAAQALTGQALTGGST